MIAYIRAGSTSSTITRTFIVGSEDFADLFTIVDEVEDERVFLPVDGYGSGVTSVWNGLEARETFVTYIVCSNG